MMVASARPAGPSVAVGAPLLRALVIQAEWCEQIFEHGKRWEIRGERCNIRERFAIAMSGTCMLVGEATLVDCFVVGKYIEETKSLVPYSQKKSDLGLFLGRQEHFDKHRIPDLSMITHPVIYAWVLDEPMRYALPKPCKHPPGAIKWVKLTR